MHSYRVLGIVALSAVVIAVVCFTAVDITIDAANGCLAARTACRDQGVPRSAIAYAVLGVVFLAGSVPFAAGWVVGMLRRPEPDSHPSMRPTRPSVILDDES